MRMNSWIIPKLISFVLFFSINISVGVVVSADNSGSDLPSVGNHFYNSGDYRQAVRTYCQALEQGMDNGLIYYNLGNAFYRMNEVGKALAAYRQSNRLSPRNMDLKANLSFVRQEVKDNLKKEASNVFNPDIFLLVHSHFSDAENVVLVLLGYSLFWIVFAFRDYLSPGRTKMFLWIMGIAVCLYSLLIYFSREAADGSRTLAFSAGGRNRGTAVVQAKELAVRSGDSDKFQVVFLLHEGAEIEIGEQRTDWLEVFLPDGRSGWAEKAALIASSQVNEKLCLSTKTGDSSL